MKTVLFCGGLGTRIRDYSENIPKPMIPIGGKPILWHLMSYYSQYGHKDFILCLGYKANVIKEFFLNYQPHIYADCVVSGFGTNVETLGDPQQDWRVTMIDTGVWRNIGERLFAVRAACRRRGDVPRQLQRRTLRRRSAGDDRNVQAERKDRLLRRRATQLSACISSKWTRTERSTAYVRRRMPISGSTAASSSFAGRSSTTARWRGACRRTLPAADQGRPTHGVQA